MNAANISTLEKGFLIANGIKINTDDRSRKIFETIAEHEPVRLEDLLTQFDTGEHEKIRVLVKQLAELDILEIRE